MAYQEDIIAMCFCSCSLHVPLKKKRNTSPSLTVEKLFDMQNSCCVSKKRKENNKIKIFTFLNLLNFAEVSTTLGIDCTIKY